MNVCIGWFLRSASSISTSRFDLKFIILNTRFVIFNEESVIVNTKFIIVIAKVMSTWLESGQDLDTDAAALHLSSKRGMVAERLAVADARAPKEQCIHEVQISLATSNCKI